MFEDNILAKYTNLPDNIFGLLSHYRVAIPGIQRHYVQGANTKKAENVRRNFIKSLLDSCEDTPVHLHFVYGPIDTNDEDTFTPVDGQQRLTTLWLLARYTAEYLPEATKNDVLQLLARFAYTDRIHAARFCHALTEPGHKWDTAKDPSVSIMSQEWFWDYWVHDETVSSMLRMLSTIHNAWTKQLQKKMLQFLAEKVTFSLQVNNFAEDIYMKMNARGLQLTQWENFKGKFAELLNGETKEKWEKGIEKLSDLYFDKSGKNLPDSPFFALAARLAVYEALMAGSTQIESQIKKLSETTNWKNDLPYVAFNEFESALHKERNEFANNYLGLISFILENDFAKITSPYWQEDRTLPQSVFEPENQNELDLSWLLFAYCRKNKDNITHENFNKAFHCMWNILANVKMEKPLERLKMFNDEFIEKGGLSLYEIKADAMYPDNCEMQYREERVKAAIYQSDVKENIELLQTSEKYMHGRVRLGILDLNNGNTPLFNPDRLKKINDLFANWNKVLDDSEIRKNIVMNIVAAEPYALQDVITIAAKGDNLRILLTTRDDKDLQGNLLKIKDDSIPDEPFVAATGLNTWQRDWRQSLLSLAELNKARIKTFNIWGRKVKYHNGSGCLYLFGSTRTYIQDAIPVSDYRIDLLNSESYKTLLKANVFLEDIAVNGSGADVTAHLCKYGDNITILFDKDNITVKYKDTEKTPSFPMTDKESVTETKMQKLLKELAGKKSQLDS